MFDRVIHTSLIKILFTEENSPQMHGFKRNANSHKLFMSLENNFRTFGNWELVSRI